MHIKIDVSIPTISLSFCPLEETPSPPKMVMTPVHPINACMQKSSKAQQRRGMRWRRKKETQLIEIDENVYPPQNLKGEAIAMFKVCTMGLGGGLNHRYQEKNMKPRKYLREKFREIPLAMHRQELKISKENDN